MIIEFTVQDGRVERGEYDSRKELKRAIDSALLNTNWKLMSEGVGYRLGILSGRLKGLEREEDLIKLIE